MAHSLYCVASLREWRQWLRENVCDLVVSADTSKLDVAAQALVSDEMVKFSHVLGPLVMDGVLRNLDTRALSVMKAGSISYWYTQ